MQEPRDLGTRRITRGFARSVLETQGSASLPGLTEGPFGNSLEGAETTSSDKE